MVLGKNRSPHQVFPRSTFDADPGDEDLLPKPTVVRPSAERQPFQGAVLKPEGPGPLPEGFLTAPDIESFPWTRRRGDEWTTPEFRALVLAWLREFFVARRGQGLIGWDITERASAERSSARLPESAVYLRLGVTKRVRDVDTRVECSIAFPPEDREGPEAEAQFAKLEASIDALLSTIS